MISPESVAEILGMVRIEDIISDYVQLKKSGSNFKGLSPFSKERTPSFYVSPSKQIFKDFSSGKGGNAVSFVMDMEQVSYPEALRILAQKYNIEIKETQSQNPEEKQAQAHRESLMLSAGFAQDFFKAQLHTEEGKTIGASYFKERGFNAKTIEKFGLGYSPSAWDGLVKATQENAYNLSYFQELGLIREKEGRLYDFFRERVVFPIQNVSGRAIAFGARTLKADKNIPKYINSPESEIYQKSKVLYGIHQAKQDIVKQNNCYLVEGYTDVLSLHQAGVENVVASAGTALTEEQVRLLQRYTSHVTLLYDGDIAGIKASLRGIDLLLKAGLNIKVVLLPEGHDPDSFAQSHNQDDILAYLAQNSLDFIDFTIKALSIETENDPIQKVKLVKEVLRAIALIPDRITQEVYIKLCAQKLGFEETLLYQELRKEQQQHFVAQKASPENNPEVFQDYSTSEEKSSLQTESSTYAIEAEIIKALLQYGTEKVLFEALSENGGKETLSIPLAEYVVLEFSQDDLTPNEEIFRKMYALFAEALQENKPLPDEKTFTTHHEQDIVKRATDLLTSPYTLSPTWAKHNIQVAQVKEQLDRHARQLLLHFKLKHVQALQEKVLKQLQENQAEENYLITRYMQLGKAKRYFAEQLGMVII